MGVPNSVGRLFFLTCEIDHRQAHSRRESFSSCIMRPLEAKQILKIKKMNLLQNRFVSQMLLIVILGFFVCSCNQSTKNTAVATEKQEEAIRGVWLTNVASEALLSKENIEEAVALLDSLGFNTIFMVTWNRGYTLYPSASSQGCDGF